MKKIKSRSLNIEKTVMPENKTIFAVVCSCTPELRNINFFETVEGARKYLKSLADERRHKLGVHWHEETDDMFFYTLGWEEAPVRFSIVEIALKK